MDYNSNHSILFEIRNHVMYIQINLPQTRNCLDWRDSLELAGAYALANETPDLRAIVVTGTGDAFHTGGWQHDPTDPYEKERFADQLRIRNKLMAEFKVPLIVAVNGECSGGGMSLLLKADVAIAAESSVFGYPEIRHGTIPVNSMVNTVDVLPKKLALQCFYFGDLFGAQEALRIGLVSKVVPDDQLMLEIDRMINQLLAHPADLISTMRTAYNAMVMLPLDERQEYGRNLFQEYHKL